MSSITLDVKQAFDGQKEVAAHRLMKAARGSVSVLLNSGALAIKALSSPTAKVGSAIHALANSTLLTKAADTDMAALSGTVTNGTFNVFCFFVDSAGTLTTLMGTAGATLGAVTFPTFEPSKACIGFVIINPTGTGDFVGGTTALDDATVTPNAVYVNTPYHFEPKANLKLEA